jgi:hypothetical protein
MAKEDGSILAAKIVYAHVSNYGITPNEPPELMSHHALVHGGEAAAKPSLPDGWIPAVPIFAGPVLSMA